MLTTAPAIRTLKRGPAAFCCERSFVSPSSNTRKSKPWTRFPKRDVHTVVQVHIMHRSDAVEETTHEPRTPHYTKPIQEVHIERKFESNYSGTSIRIACTPQNCGRYRYDWYTKHTYVKVTGGSTTTMGHTKKENKREKTTSMQMEKETTVHPCVYETPGLTPCTCRHAPRRRPAPITNKIREWKRY